MPASQDQIIAEALSVVARRRTELADAMGDVPTPAPLAGLLRLSRCADVFHRAVERVVKLYQNASRPPVIEERVPTTKKKGKKQRLFKTTRLATKGDRKKHRRSKSVFLIGLGDTRKPGSHRSS